MAFDSKDLENGLSNFSLLTEWFNFDEVRHPSHPFGTNRILRNARNARYGLGTCDLRVSGLRHLTKCWRILGVPADYAG